MNDGSISLSLLLLPAGAALTWSIPGSLFGIASRDFGLAMLAGGGLALAASLLFFASFAPFGKTAHPDKG